jgi:hypothetical protein
VNKATKSNRKEKTVKIDSQRNTARKKAISKYEDLIGHKATKKEKEVIDSSHQSSFIAITPETLPDIAAYIKETADKFKSGKINQIRDIPKPPKIPHQGIDSHRDKWLLERVLKPHEGSDIFYFDPMQGHNLKTCKFCHRPFWGYGKAEYCTPRCRLNAYYARRRKPTDKIKERHTNCVICGKSLEGKRAGTKTCSMSCRKSLSLKKGIISS